MFVKGQSGNPGGRKKKDRTVEELARQHTGAAIDALVAALSGKDRVPAAMALLAYGYGKPRQPIEHEGEITHSYVIHAPRPVENAEQWIIEHAPKELTNS